MSKPMMICKSPLSNEWYAFTAYKIVNGGKTLVATGKKWNVTEQINEIINNAVNAYREINR